MKYCLLVLIILLHACAQLKKSEDMHTSPIYNTDEYWESFVKNANSESYSLMDSIKNISPKLYQQIILDTDDLVLPQIWGQSINFDSGAKAIILDHKLIAELQLKFGIKNDIHYVHAGIMHSYGYLFSTLVTPYGFKRTRWTKPTLNYGFELIQNSLSPNTEAGTMLSNITYFAGKLAFTKKENLAKLEKLKHVSEEIKKFNYLSTTKVVLEEEITNPKNIKKIFFTTLIKLKKKMPTEDNDYLLIYTYKNLINNEEKLVTAFPIKKEAYLKIIDESTLGDDRPIIVRYNAYIETSQNDRISGKRLILSNY